MDNKLKLSPHVQVISRGDKVIYINPNIPRWIVTNQLGQLILTLFDGTNTYDQIINTAIQGLGEGFKDRIIQFCSSILSSGLLDHVEPHAREHRMKLSSVHLSLSDTCNLSCSYCYAKARVEKGYPRLTFREYQAIIDDIISINPEVIFTLTGGEPLLNKDCFSIAEHIKSRKAKVFLLSNGVLFSEKNIGNIARLFDLVTLSIDGPNETIHSLTRGNNYAKVMNAIHLLEAHHVDYTLSMTVTRHNITYLEEMSKKFGGRLNFAPYFPVLNESSDLSITGLEYYQALKSAAGVKPLSYCESSLEGALYHQCHKCSIGDGEFSISATGDVYPCQLLHTDPFHCGNVHDQSIKDIYYHSKVISRCSHLDVDTIAGCKDCPIKYICGGSCRARAYYECGDIDSTSDFCKYEQEAFYDGILSIYSQNQIE